MDVIAYIESKGYAGKRASSGEYTFPCFFLCDEDPDAKKKKLYVNAETSMYHCVTGDTEVWTPEGRRLIADIAAVDGRAEILDGNGRWVDSPVSYFGDQQVYNIEVTRNGLARTLRATDEHRWLVGGREVLTKDLASGMRLDAAPLRPTEVEFEPSGVVAGIMAGDGTVDGSRGGVVRVTDKKLDDLRPWLGEPSAAYDGVHYWRDLPPEKGVPDMAKPLGFLAGWLAGYIATDGTMQSGGANVSISSKRASYLEAVRTIAARLGIATGPILTYTQVAWGKEHEVARVTLYGENLTESLLLREAHREAFQRPLYSRLRWRVVEVAEGEVEPVFCAEVPTTQSFVIDELILTGNCKVCDEKGGSTLLMRHFGDEEDPKDGKPVPTNHRALEAAADVARQFLTNNDEMLLWLLNERGLEPDTIQQRRLGYVVKPWSLVGSTNLPRESFEETGLLGKDGRDFFYEHIIIPYIEHGRVVQLRGRYMGDRPGGKYMTGPGQRVRAYNLDSLQGASEVILTEGEFDAMILEQELGKADDERLRSMAVVALPGVNATPSGFLERGLADVRRVYIGFDGDDAGRTGAERMAEQIGPRARQVELPEGLDWSDYIVGGKRWTDVRALLDAATGKRRLWSVAEAGRSLRERPDTGGARLGFTGFDELIKPGLLPGQLAIVLAKTGVGKTLFLCNVLYNNHKQPILYITLEMTAEEVYERLLRIYYHYHPTATYRQMEQDLAHVYICDENRIGPGGITQLIDEYELETGLRPSMVFVDYLGYFAKGQPGGSPYEKTTAAAMELKAVAKESRVPIIAPHQVNRGAKAGRPLDEDDARDSGGVEETADFLLGLWKPDDVSEKDLNAQPTGEIKLSVLKSRHGGKGRQFGLQMDMLTLCIADTGSRAAKSAQEHNHLYWQGMDYPELRRLQLEPANKLPADSPW